MVRALPLLHKISRATILLVIALLLTVAGLFHYKLVTAAQLDPRSLQLSDSAAGASNVIYQLDIGVATPGTLGSIRIQFCSNTSLVNDVCDPPGGFDASNFTIISQSGETGFSKHPATTSNELILTRAPTTAGAGLASYSLGNITNGASLGTVFARVLSYPTTDASGAAVDAGGLAINYNSGITVSAEVPPFLLFCAGVSISGFNCATAEGDFIDFGTLSADATAAGVSQMLVATNAGSGYNIRAKGNTLASGTNIINPMTGQPTQLGLSQFGMNLRANVDPELGQEVQGPGSGQPMPGYNIPDRYRFVSDEVVASSMSSDDFRKFTMSYVVNVSKDQPGGIYAATMTYICLANF